LIDRHGIEVVYTTAMPFTSHRIGMALQRDGVQWVADFRDPAAHAAKVSSPSARVRSRQYDIVREALIRADAVTTTSSSYPLIFADIFGDITKRPIEFIPTGVDDALLPSCAAAQEDTPYIVYVGEIMPDQTGEFFSMLAEAMRRERGHHRLLVVGHETINRQRLAPMLENHDLAGRVEFIDHSPQAAVYRLVAGARAGVLAPGSWSYWWNNHAKLVDYVGLRKPVLAVVPDPSEARSVLTRTGLGVFLDGDAEQATATLTAFLNGDFLMPEPVAEQCDRYLASTLIASFTEVFNSVL
jgi:glycosyltransferase involved in cell wall biosynthesis